MMPEPVRAWMQALLETPIAAAFVQFDGAPPEQLAEHLLAGTLLQLSVCQELAASRLISRRQRSAIAGSGSGDEESYALWAAAMRAAIRKP